MPILLLQKPHRRSKTKDHARCLENRMKLWKEENLKDLVLEGRAIQGRLSICHHCEKAKKNLEHTFAKYMFSGKTKAALDLLLNNAEGGVLHPSNPSDPNQADSP